MVGILQQSAHGANHSTGRHLALLSKLNFARSHGAASKSQRSQSNRLALLTAVVSAQHVTSGSMRFVSASAQWQNRMMKIQVRLSAGLAYAAGQTRLTLTLADGAVVGDAIEAIVAEQSSLSGRLTRTLPMLGGRHVTHDTPLTDGAELLLLLPAAGGGQRLPRM